MRCALPCDLRCPFIMLAGAVAAAFAAGPAEAACPSDVPVPITSGTGSHGIPLVFSFRTEPGIGVFFALGAGDENHIGSQGWVSLGDLDGDGRIEYRLDVPGTGSGGWGGEGAVGCPGTLARPYPPLVLYDVQPFEDLDGDGLWDVFEDRNHNGRLDLGEDADGDGRLTPPSLSTPFGMIPGCEGSTREDVDCDGYPDTINEDLDSNSRLDPGEDLDGDRRLDNIAEDRNANGVLDYVDSNGNNRFDAGEPTEDTNLNGRLDGAGGYVEDRNYDGILNDRPAPAADDEIYLYALDGAPVMRLPPTYPYDRFRPLIGGVLLASVAWDGAAYDFDAINTQTRPISLPDGRQFRAVDAEPIGALVPHVSSVRLRFGSQSGYRVHIDGLGVRRVDDVGGMRRIFDGYQVALVTDEFDLGEVFLETGQTSARVEAERGFLTILTGPPFPRPVSGAIEITPESAGSNNILSHPPGIPRQARLRPVLDRDRDFMTLPFDLCPDVPTLPPFTSGLDTNADGLGNACDPSADPQAQVEAAWVTRTDEEGPGPRSGGAADYDAARGVVVLYGGSDDTATWEYDGTAWRRIQTPTTPGPRVGHKMVYDSRNRRALLVGGGAPGSEAGIDAWAYAGGDWSRIETRGVPPSGVSAGQSGDTGLAWDEEHGLLVLFQSTGQTWILDKSHTWRRIPTSRSPSPRIAFQMAYDPIRRMTVLEGGLRLAASTLEPDLVPLNDTWEFDGATWQEVDARGNLAPSYAGTMAYDSTRRRMVNFGGLLVTELPSFSGGGGQILSAYPSAATRLYDGSSWSYLATRPTVPPQAGPAVAYDSARHVLVVHGTDGIPPDSEDAPGITAELHLPENADGDSVVDLRDNCPTRPNPDQADFDHDGFGDVCDTCPETGNPTQRDLDRDGAGDSCDADIDGDGIPNGEDACPAVYVAGRPLTEIQNGGGADSDGDGRTDDCDPCPLDPRDDADADGVCGETDNCPTAFNPHQEDSTPDGSGDACQPVLTLGPVREDGGEELEVSAFARDPNGDPLAGSIEFRSVREFALRAVDLDHPESVCSSDTYPPGDPGKGIVYVVYPDGTSVLADLDFGLANLDFGASCDDGQPDYLIAPAPCHATELNFLPSVFVSALPQSLCVAPLHPPLDLWVDLMVTSADATMVRIASVDPTPALRIPFGNGLPERSPLGGLAPGGRYVMVIEVSDGSTRPVRAEAGFLYQGEQVLVIPRLGPTAVVRAPASVECAGPEGGTVVLDGRDSSGAAPGSAPLAFAWYEDLGLPTERLLAAGPEVLGVTLPLGLHELALRVTDADELTDTARVVVAVRDATPPLLSCPEAMTLECAGPDGTPAPLDVVGSDACSTRVRIEIVRSPGGDPDAPYPLGTTSVLVTAADEAGNVATCATAVIVRDTTPPTLTLTVDRAVLWPPNHRLVQVQVAWQVSDRCDPAAGAVLASAISSESDDAPGSGDGNTTEDIQDASIGTPDTMALLRAERSGGGPLRFYALTYAATDASGNTTSALGIVTVPHELGTGPEPVMISLEGASTPGMAHLYWNAVSGAEMYDVIQGDVSQITQSIGKIWLGLVHVLATGQSGTSYTEGSNGALPPPGSAFFYLVQYRNTRGASGWGTESSWWPAEPTCIEMGCPGEAIAASIASGDQLRK